MASHSASNTAGNSTSSSTSNSCSNSNSPTSFPITSDCEDALFKSANNDATTSSFTSGTTNDDGSTASGTSGDDVDDSAAADPTDPTDPTAHDDAYHTYHFTLLLSDGSTRTTCYLLLPALAFPVHSTGHTTQQKGPRKGSVRAPTNINICRQNRRKQR